MEAELETEERALSMGSGFYNPSDTNCAYLCSPDPLSCKESSEQVSITPFPDKMEPAVLSHYLWGFQGAGCQNRCIKMQNSQLNVNVR